MKSDKSIAQYQRLREQALWRMLASNHGPVVVALLQNHLLDDETRLSASVLFERLNRDLEELRGRGMDFPKTAQAYVADWVAAGYLERRFPPGASEEQYELSAAASTAIRFIAGLVAPRTSATESRLGVVIQQLVRLAEETDTNPKTRIAALVAERERIDREIEAIEQGRLSTLDTAQATERAREVIGLADDLAGDFRRVREEFDNLNRDLRRRIMDYEGSRGDVLEALFAGVDVIAESDAGRTFSAFWRLLTNPEQSATLEEALDDVLSRTFAEHLSYRERQFLRRLTGVLLEQGGDVHEVLQHFARSLKQFVQSREYLEQRRLNQLLREAQSLALELKDQISPTRNTGISLQSTSSSLHSLSQWNLYDPAANVVDGAMAIGEDAPIDLDTIGELVAQSEIDFRTLKQHIQMYLSNHDQASIGEIVERFPAEQGLGTIVGYVALGSRHGERGSAYETVAWEGGDGRRRSARVPVIYFLKERLCELG